MIDSWDLAEHVAEVLDIGPGTRLFEVDCRDGAFLLPFHENGYLVGGSDSDSQAIAAARQAMPDGSFEVAPAATLDPAVPWHVVICRGRDAGPDPLPGGDELRGLLSRMFAKATHAIALLAVADERRTQIMRALAEIGARAIQFEAMPAADAGTSSPTRCNVFARV